MSLKELKTEFSQMQKEYDKNDKLRDQIIVLSRDIIKPSKQAIYALHRDDLKTAKKLITHASKNILKAEQLLKKYNSKNVGAYTAALEEYVEARCYESFILTQSFPTAKKLKVNSTIYLLGLADCTGELARRAVKLAIEDDKKGVENINKVLGDLVELFLNISFRGIDMRKKLEGLKYNLVKTQNILYDMKMKGSFK